MLDYLIPLIEWYISSEHNSNITKPINGRLFQNTLTTDLWGKQIEQTFSGSKKMIIGMFICNGLI